VSRRTRLFAWSALPLVAAASVLAWAAFSPVASDDRDEVFEIPKGTWARRMAGDKVEILPSEVRLTLGVKDVLVLKNHDDVPQIFGPTLMMPGQSFRLPFATASSYTFACTAHASGQMTVTVDPVPAAGWERLAWRTRSLMSSRGTN
jgi:plastocyanin